LFAFYYTPTFPTWQGGKEETKGKKQEKEKQNGIKTIENKEKMGCGKVCG